MNQLSDHVFVQVQTDIMTGVNGNPDTATDTFQNPADFSQ